LAFSKSCLSACGAAIFESASIFTAFEAESLSEPELEEKAENTIALLDTKTTENPLKEKKAFSNIKAYIWIIISVILALFIIVLLYSDGLFKKSYKKFLTNYFQKYSFMIT